MKPAVLRLAAVAAVAATACAPNSAVSAARCAPGVWDIATTGKTVDGQAYQGAATSTRYCLFGGALEMDEFRALAPDGNVVFLGVSFQSWSPDRQRVKTLWVMGGDPGYTLIDGAVEDGVLVSEGRGADAAGAFLERSTQTSADDRGYHFDMDRSYDGGATWINSFSAIDATFRTAETPPLPKELHPIITQGNDKLAGARSGVPILDGFAEIEEIKAADGASAPTLRFSSRYLGPDRWRSVFWTLGADEIRVEEQAIVAPPNNSE